MGSGQGKNGSLPGTCTRCSSSTNCWTSMTHNGDKCPLWRNNSARSAGIVLKLQSGW